MKLLLAIVQDQDAGTILDALMENNYRATRINTAGGFLRRGNATLLIGVDDAEVDRVIQLLNEHTQARPATEASGVTIGAGTVFVLPVQAFLRL
jgi:uncharacterized protein YaaQ